MVKFSQLKLFVGRTADLLSMHLAANELLRVGCLFPRGRYWLLDIKRTKIIGTSPVIFDVGANTGQTAHDLAKFYPKGRIYCFEPVNATCEKLRKKYKKFPNFHISQVALGSSPGHQEIPLHQNSELNTLVKNQPRTDDLLQKTEKIRINTIDNFTEKIGIPKIDILKIDVQGWELEVLRGATNMLENQRIKFIFAEVGFRRADSDMQYFEDLNSFLQAKGFWLAGFYDQFRWGLRKEMVGFANVMYILRQPS